MIPGSFGALLLFAAAIGPGYIWVRVAEKREPRRDRTPLLEVAELVFVGAIASGLAGLVVFWAGHAIGLVDLRAFVLEGKLYLIKKPFNVLGILAVTFALSYVSAWGVARRVKGSFIQISLLTRQSASPQDRAVSNGRARVDSLAGRRRTSPVGGRAFESYGSQTPADSPRATVG